MLHSHCHHYLFFSNLPVPLSLFHHHYSPLSHPSPSLLIHRPSTLHTVSAIPQATSSWLTHLAQLATVTEEGPIQLPFSTSIFATTDDPSTIQVASTVLLTGAITLFLFRSLRRRAKRAKELVRQITITIRTIINGLCYLATFVYGINSLGLLLYSGELALNTFVGGPGGKGPASKITEQSGLSNSSAETLTSNNRLDSTKEDQNSKNS